MKNVTVNNPDKEPTIQGLMIMTVIGLGVLYAVATHVNEFLNKQIPNDEPMILALSVFIGVAMAAATITAVRTAAEKLRHQGN